MNPKRHELNTKRLFLCALLIAPLFAFAQKEKSNRNEGSFKSKLTLSQATQTFTVNELSFEMVYIAEGSFIMGCTEEQSTDCKSDEKPSHLVNLDAYYMGKCEVTQELWVTVMGSNPSRFKGDN